MRLATINFRYSWPIGITYRLIVLEKIIQAICKVYVKKKIPSTNIQA